jgi:hypothetical protein
LGAAQVKVKAMQRGMEAIDMRRCRRLVSLVVEFGISQTKRCRDEGG